MSAHSPGPWRWVPFENWDGGLQAADDSWVIMNDEDDACPENEADARLLAAAPDLLEALEGMTKDTVAWESKARALIACVKGEG